MENCELTLGNCMDLFPTLADKSVDLILTDIPYDKVNRDSNGLRNLDKGHADVATFNLPAFLEQCVRVCRGSIYVFCSTEQVSEIREFLSRYMSTRLCIHEKTNPSPMNGQHIWLSSIECCVFGKFPKATFNEFCKSSVWRFPTQKSKIHPTQKPLPLFEYICCVSSNPGDVVLDPCLGSGTAGVAAIKNGRKFIGWELQENYFNSASERIKSCLAVSPRTPRQSTS